MSYQISESEYYKLESVRNQLELIDGLLNNIVDKKELSSISGDVLASFLRGRFEEIDGILVALNERYELQLQQKHKDTMSAVDWVYALRIAQDAATYTPAGAKACITRKLAQEVSLKDDMRGVYGEWLKILENKEKSPTVQSDPKALQLYITPDLLIGLMDAASGHLTESDALIKIWDVLYTMGVEHPSYEEVLRNFREILQSKGLVLRTEFYGDRITREVCAENKNISQTKKNRGAKSSKRERLVTGV